MPFVPVPNTVMVEMVFEYDGQICENVYHAEATVAYDASTIANLLDVYRNWWDVNMQPQAPQSLSLVNMIGTDQASSSGPRVEDSAGLPLVGGLVTDNLPNNVTFVVKWLTELRGRSFRGRTYHIGIGEGQCTKSQIHAANLAIWTTAYGTLLTDVVAAGWTPVVVSRVTEGAPRITGVATPITSFSIDSFVDSQRRRLPGRGR